MVAERSAEQVVALTVYEGLALVPRAKLFRTNRGTTTQHNTILEGIVQQRGCRMYSGRVGCGDILSQVAPCKKDTS